MYSFKSSKLFEEDLKRLKKSEPPAYKKALSFIREVSETPQKGLGKPKPLVGLPEGQWSRRLSDGSIHAPRVECDAANAVKSF